MLLARGGGGENEPTCLTRARPTCVSHLRPNAGNGPARRYFARNQALDSLRLQFGLCFALFLTVGSLLYLYQCDKEHDEDDGMHGGTPGADGVQFHDLYVDEVEDGQHADQ